MAASLALDLHFILTMTFAAHLTFDSVPSTYVIIKVRLLKLLHAHYLKHDHDVHHLFMSQLMWLSDREFQLPPVCDPQFIYRTVSSQHERRTNEIWWYFSAPFSALFSVRTFRDTWLCTLLLVKYNTLLLCKCNLHEYTFVNFYTLFRLLWVVKLQRSTILFL